MKDFISKPVNNSPEPEDQTMDAEKKHEIQNEEPTKKVEKVVEGSDNASSKQSKTSKKAKKARKIGRKAAKEQALKELTHGKDADELRDEHVADLKSVALMKESLEERGKVVNDEVRDYRPDHAKSIDEDEEKEEK